MAIKFVTLVRVITKIFFFSLYFIEISNSFPLFQHSTVQGHAGLSFDGTFYVAYI